MEESQCDRGTWRNVYTTKKSLTISQVPQKRERYRVRRCWGANDYVCCSWNPLSKKKKGDSRVRLVPGTKKDSWRERVIQALCQGRTLHLVSQNSYRWTLLKMSYVWKGNEQVTKNESKLYIYTCVCVCVCVCEREREREREERVGIQICIYILADFKCYDFDGLNSSANRQIIQSFLPVIGNYSKFSKYN